MSKVTLSYNGKVIGTAESVEVRNIPALPPYPGPIGSFVEGRFSGVAVNEDALSLLLGCPRPKRHMKSRKWFRRRNKQYARWVHDYGWLYGMDI